jgi:hypothetical protein
MGDLPNADGFVTGGINDAGQIVGYYPDRFLNVSHGFLATPSAPANRAPVASNITANENEDASPVTLDALFTDPYANDTFTFSVNATGTIGKVTNK